MYKNQLQELAQRSCFNLPSYSCIREGPDHAPRFKATVNFNGESFESPAFCSTLRQAEHAAAEVALNTLASRGPSRNLAARVLDETGVHKNLLQETAHRAGLKLPVYTTIRSGPGHVPMFLCMVELAGMSFNGEPARTKKRAQKNAAMAAWSALKRMVQHDSSSFSLSSSSVETKKGNEEQEQVIVARLLASLQPTDLKNSKPKNLQCSQDRFIPICGELTLPTPNLYAVHGQGWEDQNFSPAMAIYQMWQQEQLLLLQNHLLALHVPLAPPPGPQILPSMHSVLPCDSRLFFPVRGHEPTPAASRIATATTAPPLYLANHIVSDPSEGKSMVTIQEIHEKSTEESPECSPSTVSDTPVLGNLNVEQRLKESVHEKDEPRGAELENKIESTQPGKRQAEQCDWASHGSLQPEYKPVDFQVQNPCGFDFSPSAQLYPLRSSLPRSYSPPVMIRTVRPVHSSTSPSIQSMMPVSSFPRPQDLAAPIAAPPRMRIRLPSYSAKAQPQRLDIGRLHPRFMAPAVRIRSVVPVCSAPPPREMPSYGQEGVLPNQNTEDTMP